MLLPIMPFEMSEMLSEMVNSSSLVRSKVKNQIAQPLDVPPKVQQTHFWSVSNLPQQHISSIVTLVVLTLP